MENQSQGPHDDDDDDDDDDEGDEDDDGGGDVLFCFEISAQVIA